MLILPEAQQGDRIPAPDRDVYLPFDARNFPAEYRQIFRRSGSHDDHPRSRQDRCRYGEKRIASQYSGNLNEKDQPTVGFFHKFAWKSG